MTKTRTTAALLLLAAVVSAIPLLTVGYHRDAQAAPLFDACLYADEFRARYGLYLRPTSERSSCSLFDGKRNLLPLKLVAFSSDSSVLAALLDGSVQVGILGSERVFAAVLKGRALRIVAPLQRACDQLVVNPAVPVADWREFLAWVKARPQPAVIGYIGQYSMAALGLMQALEYEHVRFATSIPGTSVRPESAKMRLVLAENRAALAAELSAGRFDAAVLEAPDATWVSVLRGCRIIARTDILPPGRFEDHPGAVIAAADSTIRLRGEDVSRFLELMAVATHYANNRTRNTLSAVSRWLGTSPGRESIPLRCIGFSSRPDVAFTTGIWNWYFALRLRNAVPQNLAGYMEEKDWLGVPYDSLLLVPALDRAGARIIK